VLLVVDAVAVAVAVAVAGVAVVLPCCGDGVIFWGG
jgi:hypothetical protein